MDLKIRIVAAALGVLAGLLHIYNALAERAAGAEFPLGDVSMGLFWMAFGIWIYSSRPEKR